VDAHVAAVKGKIILQKMNTRFDPESSLGVLNVLVGVVHQV
jgi:hypothetical protein